MKNIKLVFDNVVNSQIFIHTLNNCKESMYSYGKYMNISYYQQQLKRNSSLQHTSQQVENNKIAFLNAQLQH